jgi:hypothetical protein
MPSWIVLFPLFGRSVRGEGYYTHRSAVPTRLF